MLSRFGFISIFLLFISIFLIISPDVRAGNPIISTDGGAERLVYYFDNRGRTTYVQLANISDTPALVHVQVFVVNGFTPCEETDWIDNFTPFDTHNYDMTNLVRNDGTPLIGDLEGKYGFVVVSLDTGASNPLVGVLRITDDAGYEYRANAAAPQVSPAVNQNVYHKIDFSLTSNNYSHSDVIGITYVELSPSDVYASPGVSSVFGNFVDLILIHDEDEEITSCSSRVFSCQDGFFNIGIDTSLPNSRGETNRICVTDILGANESGSVELTLDTFFCTDPFVGDMDGNCMYNAYFVGFIGLNNNSDAGSFDSWWEKGFKD